LKHAARAAMALGDTLDVFRFQPSRVRQCVNPDDRGFESIAPAEIECSSRWRSDRHSAHDARLVIAEPVAVNDDAVDAAGVTTDQLSR
jgi:hypothetical protein